MVVRWGIPMQPPVPNTSPQPAVQGRIPGICTTCEGPVGPGGVYFPQGGGCCRACLSYYRSSDSPQNHGSKKKKKKVPRRRMSTAPYWLNETTWMCPKHIPSARIPSNQDVCWFGCGTHRPDVKEYRPRPTPVPPPHQVMRQVVVPPLVPVAITPSAWLPKFGNPVDVQTEAPKIDVPSPKVATPPPPVVQPPPVKVSTHPHPQELHPPASQGPLHRPSLKGDVVDDGSGPSEAERRRGATFPVGCLECGTRLWRRQKEIEAGLRPFCCAAHRGAYDLKMRSKA